MAEHTVAPHERKAQQRLADAVTELIHGADAVASATLAASVMFGSAVPSAEELLSLRGVVPEAVVEATGLGDEPFVDLLIASELASSKRDARQALKDGAVRWNGEKVDGTDSTMLKSGAVAMLQKGKRNKRLVVIE